jgi:hypothetical protein
MLVLTTKGTYLEKLRGSYPEQEANGAITDINSCTEDALATSADVLGI